LGRPCRLQPGEAALALTQIVRQCDHPVEIIEKLAHDRDERERWLFWRFHDRGRRAGIRGPVDLDAFRGSINDLVVMTR
jgi:hypothetical protein